MLGLCTLNKQSQYKLLDPHLVSFRFFTLGTLRIPELHSHLLVHNMLHMVQLSLPSDLNAI